MNATYLHYASLLWIVFALLVFPMLLRVRQPYGRHTSASWGGMMDNRWGWVIQESPSLIVVSAFFWMGSAVKTPATYILWGLWTLHYTYRSFIFPFRTRTTGKKIPILIVFSAIVFNLINGGLNGYYLGYVGIQSDWTYLLSPRFIAGFFLFGAGMILNHWSDYILLHLRQPEETGYRIPFGLPFRYISCPNYLGEIMEWTGYALMAGGLPALSFAIWTAVNLIPRALDHHRWYRERFPDYPSERSAILPRLL